MTDEELRSYSPKDEREECDYREEREYREWCKSDGLDPLDEFSREMYNEMQAETGQEFWDGLDEDDRDGWNDNIIKSFD